MIDVGSMVLKNRKNRITDVVWRVLVSCCVVFSVVKVFYFFHCDALSENLQVDVPAIKTENPLTIYERMLEQKDVCDSMHVFLVGPKVENIKPKLDCSEPTTTKEKETKNMTEANLLKSLVIDLMLVFLLYLGLTALLDVFKERKKDNGTDSDSALSRRCSLAEYANMKHSRKNSSMSGKEFCLGFMKKESTRPKLGQLNRFESLGTAYSRMRRESMCTGIQNHVTGNETPNTPPMSTTRMPLKLLGARPPPLIRRSSFPASVLLEGGQQNRRGSIDSEDDSSPDTSRRRCRLIRRH